jgi:hypothetical protein
MKTLAVYQTLRAPRPTAAWLRARLQPVILACKFAQPIPLELRPTGKFRGWADRKDYQRDGRVCITNQVVFWRPDQLLEVYLHECAHRLLEGCEVDAHGPEFFALTATLYVRAAHLFERDALNFLQIYDFQDVPDGDRGAVLDWAFSLAKELATSDKTAEELAVVVCQKWQQNVKDVAARKLQTAREKSAHINLKLEVKIINTKLFLWRGLSAVGWAAMIATAYFSIVR